MDKEELIMSQYRLYSEQKEKFVDRAFMTNKFYMVLILALFFLVYVTQHFALGRLSAPCVFCISGMISCALWWLNVDSYNCLIKIKFSKVLEEIEKQLPYQPYAMEYKAIKDYRRNKKGFLFSDIQKMFAIVAFLLFFILLLIDSIPRFVSVGL